jgi:predicted dithiol-disulfide oxidoreductase (DUF899 family)
MNIRTAEVSATNHPVVSNDRWRGERRTMLAREKELTRLRDQIASERRALPWVRIAENYVFDTPDGRRTLADLGAVEQLVVQYAAQMTLDVKVSDAVFQALRQHFDTTELVELTSAIATYNMVERFLVALGVSPEEHD